MRSKCFLPAQMDRNGYSVLINYWIQFRDLKSFYSPEGIKKSTCSIKTKIPVGIFLQMLRFLSRDCNGLIIRQVPKKLCKTFCCFCFYFSLEGKKKKKKKRKASIIVSEFFFFSFFSFF